jgi:transposase
MRVGIFLKTKDQLKAEIVYKISSKQISRSDGLRLLGVSERTLERYLRGFRTKGIGFVTHGNKGRAPINKGKESLKQQVLVSLREKYFDFNMLHAQEKIQEELGVKITREVFRTWCHDGKASQKTEVSPAVSPRAYVPSWAHVADGRQSSPLVCRG